MSAPERGREMEAVTWVQRSVFSTWEARLRPEMVAFARELAHDKFLGSVNAPKRIIWPSVVTREFSLGLGETIYEVRGMAYRE